MVQDTLITLLAGGHALLVGVPGLAKTRLVETLGVVLGWAQKRVQFTPDLMPADILGSEVLDDAGTGRQSLPLHPRADLRPAADGRRDQPRQPTHPGGAAAGDAGAQVTVAGQDLPCRRPFHVLATQNPIEQEGTYPLPEAQLDRSCCRSTSTIPTVEAERRMMIATTTVDGGQAAAGARRRDLMGSSGWSGGCRSASSWSTLILRLVRAGRPENEHLPGLAQQVAWGPGPRASQA